MNTSINNFDFFLYDNKYSKYSFTILLKSIRIDEGRAAVVNSDYHLWFLHELHKDIGGEGTKALNQIISLKADSETIVLFGTNNYCTDNNTAYNWSKLSTFRTENSCSYLNCLLNPRSQDLSTTTGVVTTTSTTSYKTRLTSSSITTITTHEPIDVKSEDNNNTILIVIIIVVLVIILITATVAIVMREQFFKNLSQKWS